MASRGLMPSYLPPRRTPKLRYRNSASLNTTISTTLPASPSGTTDPCPSPRYLSSETDTYFQGRRPSSAISSLSPHAMDKKAKKKKSGFFSGLFGVKEPSAQALQDYQKQMLKSEKKDRKSAKGRPATVGMGISSAKLPPTVPKVNSKWDGQPPTRKERKEEKKKQQLATRRSMSDLASSLKTNQSREEVNSLRTAELRRPSSQATLGSNSISSTGSGNYLADLYGWETPSSSGSSSSRDWAPRHRRRPSISHSGPTMPVPVLRHCSTFPVDVPKIPAAYLVDPSTPPMGSPAPPDHSHSPGLTPYNSSPATPNSPSPMTTLASSTRKNGRRDRLKTTTIEAPASVDRVIVKSSGIGILGPPTTVRQPPQNGIPLIGVLKSGMLSAPTSDGHRRSNSARERLSLGAKLKYQAVPPWGWSELHPEAQSITNATKSVSPTPKGGLRRKRLTFFKKPTP